MDDALAEAKAGLRRDVLERRRAVSTAARAAANDAIAAAIRSMPEYARAPRVAAYVAQPDEASLASIVEELLRERRELLLPRLDDASSSLVFALVHSLDELCVGRFGLREPRADARVAVLQASDLVFVPGVAFDLRGGRLGRGLGCYDRSLPTGSDAPFVCGVGFALQLVDAVPCNALDRRLDGLVTERGVVRVGDRPSVSG